MNYISTETLAYPVSEREIRAANPNTSFPWPFAPPDDYTVVFAVPQPEHDPITQSAREIAPVLTDKGHWEQAWEVVPLYATQAEADAAVAAYQAEKSQALQLSIVSATQARLDEFAKTRNYDGILSACTYATSTVPRFQSEGQYCVNARDATWATLYQIFDDVTNGIKPMPSSFAEIEPLLPVLEWPAS